MAKLLKRSSLLSVASGILLSLVSIIFFLSAYTPINILAYAIYSVFGFVGYYVFLPFLFLCGVYLIFLGKLRKIRFGTSLWGIFIILVALSALFSYYGSYGQTFTSNSQQITIDNVQTYINTSNFIDYYSYSLDAIRVDGQIVSETFLSGGGFVGTFLLALLNATSIGPMLMFVVVIILLICGILLLFNQELKLLYLSIKKRIVANKEKRALAATTNSEEPLFSISATRPNLDIDLGRKEEEKPAKVQRFSKKERKAAPVQEQIQVSGKLINPNRDDDIEEDDSLIYSDRYATLESTKSIRSPKNSEDLENSMIKKLNNYSSLKKAHFSLYEKEEPMKATFDYKKESNDFGSDIEPAKPLIQEEIPAKVPSFSMIEPEEEEIIEEVKPQPINQFDDYSSTSDLTSNEEIEPISVEEEDEIPEPEPIIVPQIEPVVQPIEPEPIIAAPEPPKESEPAVNPNDPLYVAKAKPRKPYILPPINLLIPHQQEGDSSKNDESCRARSEIINSVFQSLKLNAYVISYTVGPSVTRYNIGHDPSLNVERIRNAISNISVALGGVVVRFEPIVIGHPYSGLEIANEIRTNVGLRETIEEMGDDPKNRLDIPFGKSITGEIVKGALPKFPHMLVAGTTGSGKSIFMHSLIVSLLMHNRPDELKLVLIDPKKVEMTYYKNIPHLLCPVISEASKAKVALDKLVDEMERRYLLFEKFSEHNVRDIDSFNKFAASEGLEQLPFIVVFIDEYADLVMAEKNVGIPVVRIGQKARAAGIHLVISTQRPEVKIITGDIKANLPTRVALMVGSAIDSQTIIGEGGAEKLLGNGDLLVDSGIISKTSKPRVQGCFADMVEINAVAKYCADQQAQDFDPRFLDLVDHSKVSDADFVPTAISKEATEEELYLKIKEDIMHREYASISYLTRTYGIGFPKAGRLFNKLMNDGVVSKEKGTSLGSKVIMRANDEPSENPGSIYQSYIGDVE